MPSGKVNTPKKEVVVSVARVSKFKDLKKILSYLISHFRKIVVPIVHFVKTKTQPLLAPLMKKLKPVFIRVKIKVQPFINWVKTKTQPFIDWIKKRQKKVIRFAIMTLVFMIPMGYIISKNIRGAMAAPWSKNHSTYSQRKGLTLINSSGQTFESGTTYKVTIDTKSLVRSGNLLSTCDDLKVLYQPDNDTAIELKRNLEYASGETCSTSSASFVVFQLQENISDGDEDSDYYLYYGDENAEAYNETDALDAYNIGSAEATFVAPFNGTTTALAAGIGSPSTATGAIRYSGAKTAMSFDGQSDSVTNSNGADILDVTQGTVELWVKSNLESGRDWSGVDDDYIFGARTLPSESNRIYIKLGTDGNLEIGFSDTAEISTGDPLIKDIWHHIALVWQNSTQVDVYLDGTNVYSATRTALTSAPTTIAIASYPAIDRLFFNGTIDDVRISNTARYTENFTPQTAPFVRDEYTKLLYHFDENGDDPRNTGKAIDDSGNGNHGTITGARYVGGLVGVDNSSSTAGYQPNQAYASHGGIFLEEGTTNIIPNPSFEHATYNTNWSVPDASPFEYDSTADTFTAGAAKRNGSTAPFAAGVMIQGAYTTGNGDPADEIEAGTGALIGNNFYSNVDTNQGSISFWITPEWDGDDGRSHRIIYGTGSFYLDKWDDGFLVFSYGPHNVQVDVSSWTAGETHHIVASWDVDNTINGSTYGRLSIDDQHTYNGNGGSSHTPVNLTVGLEDYYAANAIIEGLTVYRRPLFDGTYGFDVGNGDEIAQIYGGGTAPQDPTLITGSWDVVFALPTNSITGTLASGTGAAWSHPHSSNLIPGNSNTGGFMMDGEMDNDGWEQEGAVGDTDSIEYDATTTIMNAGSDPTLNNLHYDALTVEAWIRADGWGEGNSGTTSMVVQKNNVSGWRMQIDSSGGLAAFIDTDGTNARSNSGSDEFTTDGEWHHVAFTYDNDTNRTIELFIDGAEVNSYGVSDPATGVVDDDSSGNLIMGNNPEASWTFDGAIGWVRVSNSIRYTTGFTPPSRWSPPAGDANTVAQWNMDEGTGTSVTNDGGASSCGGTPANCNGTLGNGSWNDGGALTTTEKIYAGGYKYTSNTADQGIYDEIAVTSGDDFVVRGVVHSDGTCAPSLLITGADDGEITHLDGTTSSTRTDPDVLLFTFEADTTENIKVKLINTAASGTCYWHQVEVLSNLRNNPSAERCDATCLSSNPWVPTGWTDRYMESGDSSEETSTVHSGGRAVKYNSIVNDEGHNTGYASSTDGAFHSLGMFIKVDSGQLDIFSYSDHHYLQSTLNTPFSESSTSANWVLLKGVSRKGDYGALNTKSTGTSTGYADDVYTFELDPVSLTVTPANEANSTETTGIRVDGSDTLTQPIGNITTTSGTISFKITPRHSWSTTASFGTTSPVLATFYSSANDYIKVYRYSADVIRAEGVFNGTTVAANSVVAPTLDAGTSYNITTTYAQNGNLNLYIGSSLAATTAMSTAAFGTTPSVAYWGSDSSGANQYDATIDEPDPAVTATENTDAAYIKFGSKSAKLVSNTGGSYVTSIDTGNTNPHTLSAYVYDGTTGNVGGTVDSSVASLIFNSSTQTTTYTDMGGGWWRLSYTGTPGESSQDYGVQIQPSKTIYVDGVQMERKLYATSYTDGSLGDEYSWSGIANESISSRTQETLTYSNTDSINCEAGSISFWIKKNQIFSSTNEYYPPIVRTNTNPEGAIIIDQGYQGNSIRFSITGYNPGYYGYSSSTSISGWSLNSYHHVVATWNEINMILYVDGSQADQDPTGDLAIACGDIFSFNQTTFHPKSPNQTISDFRVYNDDISSTEVADLYYSGLGSHMIDISPTQRFSSLDPVLAWHLDEGYGTVSHDSTTQLNHGNITEASWSEDSFGGGPSSKSLEFDGTDDYISRTYTGDSELNPSTDPFAVSTWFKHSTTIPSTQTLISRYNTAGYKLYMDTSGYICFGIDDDITWGPDDSVCTTTSYADNEWHHVQAVKGDTNIELYLDGVQAGTTAITVTGSLSGWYLTFYVGIDSDGSSNPWDGFIDEVRVYNESRTANEVLEEYIARGSNIGVSAQFGSEAYLSKGLVGYWKMDEDSWDGTTDEVIDSSGYENHGTAMPSGSEPTTGVGKFGRGGEFEADNSTFLNITDNTTLSTGDIDITISAWVKAENENDGYIIAKETPSNQEFELGKTNGNPARFCWYWTCVEDTFYETFPTNEWVFVLAYHDSNRDEIGISVNGGTFSTASASGGVDSDADLKIGMPRWEGGYWDGMIDEVRYYKRLLTPIEMRSLYKWAPGPLVYLDYNEGSGITAYDKSGNEYNGTLEGTYTRTTGKYGGGVVATSDATSPHDTVSFAEPDPILSGAYTVGLWIKPMPTIDPWTSTELQYNWHNQGTRISHSCTSNGIEHDYSGSGYSTTLTHSTICDGDWHYWAVTYDGSSEIKVYIDGINEDTDTINPPAWASGGYKWFLRVFNNGETVAHDEAKLYNYARTPEQIISDMNAGHPAPGSPVGSAIGHWEFDEGYGDIAYDSGIGGNNGNLADATVCPQTGDSACPSWTNDGKFGKALVFDTSGTTDDYVTMGSPDNLDDIISKSGGMTVSTWIKTPSAWNIPSSDQQGCFVRKWDGTTGWSLYNQYNGKPLFYARYSTTPAVARDGTRLDNNTWYHLVGTIDNSDKIPHLYINGKEATYTGTDGTHTPGVGNYVTDVDLNLTVGGSPGAVNSFFHGIIDEVKIYNFALTPDQVITEYNHGMAQVMGNLSTDSSGLPSQAADRSYCPPGNYEGNCAEGQDPSPVAEWNFEEGSGQYANDTSGNGNQGTLGANSSVGTDDPTWANAKSIPSGSAGLVGKILEFDKVNDRINAGNNSTLQNLHHNAFTFETWAKLNSAGEGEGGNFGNLAVKNWTDGWVARLSQSDGFNVLVGTDGTSASSASGLDDYSFDGKWHHLAFTYDDDGDRRVYLYVDGKEVEDYHGGQISATGTADDDSSGNLYIGNNQYSAYTIDGELDNVRIYNYARTPAQIAWDYNRGGPLVHYEFDECSGSTAHNTGGDPFSSSQYDANISIGASGAQTSLGSCSSTETDEAWNNGTNGKFYSSMSFDGSDDYVSVSPNPLSASSSTIATWVKPDKTTPTNSEFIVYGSYSPVRVYFYRGITTGNLTVRLGSSDTYDTGVSIPANTWSHVALTWGDNTWYAYLNGKQIASSIFTGLTEIGGGLYIGSYGTDLSLFDGQIDDVRVYNYALTPEQIKLIMNGGAVRFD